jgi:uncharacterized damage-inducible protein DinB
VVREIVDSVDKEYRRYKAMAERTFEQLTAEQLTQVPAVEANSIAVIAWHISGNLKSRFTDFLGTDGEKPWRDRESEFDSRLVGHDELRLKWEDGWSVLFAAVGELSDADLAKRVTIRGESLAVHAALHRSLAHTANHVGQIVLLGKMLKGAEWRTLSIPRQRRG